MRLLNFLSKVKQKSSEKLRGKKGEIATTLALVATLFFGAFRSRHVKDQYQYYPISEKLAHKKVISDQELNSLDDFHNSGQMIQTGNVTILRFEQEVSDASSNKILFEHNLNEPNEVILVKYDGILPGADGYPLNNNPRRHPPGRPRMRRQEFPIGTGLERSNIKPIGTCPDAPSSKLFQTPRTQGYDNQDSFSVNEKFESKAVKRLAKKTLNNQAVKKEYARIKKRIEEGVHPMNINKKSVAVGDNKVLIKGADGRYVVEVSDTHVDILGMSYRGDKKNIKTFQKLMNDIYGVNLQY